MAQDFTLAQFLARFPDEDSCLEEIKRLRFPDGIYCTTCQKITHHYKLSDRTAYSCKYCRTQTYPLAGTLFEKTTTPLRLWLFTMFLMTHTRGEISAKQLQREFGVTYKTAWRMYTQIHSLMARNNGDLLARDDNEGKEISMKKWTFFNALEFKVVNKSSQDDLKKKK